MSSDPPRTVLCIGNAHIDPVWLWPWSDGLDAVLTTYAAALDRMAESPKFHFSCSAAATYAWVEHADPELFERIRAAVAAGQWELVAGWWVQPDCNIPGGESFVRQGLYGQRYFERAFGRRATTGYNVDSFGHAATLPQILRGCSLKAYVFCRPDSTEKPLPSDVFWWQAPGGARVLGIRPPNHYGSGPMTTEQMQARLREAAERVPAGLRTVVCLYGVGNHGGGPTKAQMAAIESPAPELSDWRVEYGTLDGYLTAIADEAAGMPVVDEELQHHARGCYAAHSGIKAWTRRTEHLLLQAERLATIAHLLCGRPYPHDDLARAWQALLFNQFHDTLAGTAVAEAYTDARDAFGFACHIAVEHLHLSARQLARHADTRGENQAIVVFNSLPWPRRALVTTEGAAWGLPPQVTDATGRRTASQRSGRHLIFHAELPALGFSVYSAGSGEQTHPVGDLSGGETWLENEFWRVELDSETGRLCSIRDRSAGTEYLASPSRLVVLDDQSDTWGHGIRQFGDEIGEFRLVRIVPGEQGPVRRSIFVVSRHAESELVEEYLLEVGSPIISVRCRLHHKGTHQALKWTVSPSAQEPEYTWEVPYGHITRPAGTGEEAMQRWIDATGQMDGGVGGITIFNDSKYSADIVNGAMRLTILRSPIYAFHDPARTVPDAVYHYEDQGEQEYTLWLLPHHGPWQQSGLARVAEELHNPVLPVVAPAHAGEWGRSASWLAVTGMVAAVLKVAEDGQGVIIRGYEPVGEETEVQVDFPAVGASWTGPVAGHEIVTLLRTADDIRQASMLEDPED